MLQNPNFQETVVRTCEIVLHRHDAIGVDIICVLSNIRSFRGMRTNYDTMCIYGLNALGVKTVWAQPLKCCLFQMTGRMLWHGEMRENLIALTL